MDVDSEVPSYHLLENLHLDIAEEVDVDILVEFQKVPDLFTFIELEIYLERILKKKVDLVEKNGLRPRLKDIILNEVVYV